MARTPKPVEQHVLDGTYRKDRHGPLPDEGDFKPPEMPPGIGDLAAQFWERITELLKGVVRDRDGPQLHQLCFWWAQWETCEIALTGLEIGTIQHARVFNAASTASQNFDRIARRFGLTPADRAALKAERSGPPKAKVATKPAIKLDKQGPPKKGK